MALVLVASATATCAGSCVEALSAAGTRVRAFVRKLDDPRVAHLKTLPHVEFVAGDLGNVDDVARALAGVTRVMLVSGAFAYEQFEGEWWHRLNEGMSSLYGI